MDVTQLNEKAWDSEVGRNNFWTRIAEKEKIEKAFEGRLEITLTPCAEVPESWCSEIGKKVLALAAGGGQQAILLAAAGHEVTLLDNSSAQLEQDRKAAREWNLSIDIRKGTMCDLSCFPDGAFDTVINPVSLNFIPDVRQVFREVSRVLVDGGRFMFGIANPVMYIFDVKALEKGRMKLKYTLPFSCETSLSEKQREKMKKENDTFEYSHTLDDIINGVISEGFVIKGFYSDHSDFEPVDSWIQDCYLAFLCEKVRN